MPDSSGPDSSGSDFSGPEFSGPEFSGWPDVLSRLTAGQILDAPTVRAVVNELLEGRATPAQIGGLLLAWRTRGETSSELSAVLREMRRFGVGVELGSELAERAIDTCGTGGDRTNTVNISTMAALVAAAAGVPVCKHGNRSASSACGTADVLEALGAQIERDPLDVASDVGELGFGFCFAPKYHPAMRHVGPTRRELGTATLFNFLGPLANPARVRRQVVGVSDPAMADRLLDVLVDQGAKAAMVVHGADGLDELSTTGLTTVSWWRDGERGVEIVDPATLGLQPATLEQIQGGDAARNADLLRSTLENPTGPIADVVALNAAAALQVGDAATGWVAALALARQVMADGAPARLLDAWVQAHSTGRPPSAAS